MKLNDEDADALRRLLRALDGIQPHPIVVGGQSARLLRLHPLASALPWPPILTTDTDVAMADRGHRGGDLGAALARQGFAAVLEGDDTPPRTHYRSGVNEVELIVPDAPRRRSSGATVPVLGASAQKVKDLEPILVNPITIEVENVGRVPLPNPAAYVLQKALTLTNRRSLAKKGKDALYIHDVLLLFTQDGRLRSEVIDQAAAVDATLTQKQKARVAINIGALGDPRTDFIQEAARQAEGRPTIQTPDAIALANRLGLAELLGRTGPHRK